LCQSLFYYIIQLIEKTQWGHHALKLILNFFVHSVIIIGCVTLHSPCNGY